jgi:hypothetical protein
MAAFLSGGIRAVITFWRSGSVTQSVFVGFVLGVTSGVVLRFLRLRRDEGHQ